MRHRFCLPSRLVFGTMALLVALGAITNLSGCGAARAPIQVTPGADSVQATRVLAIRIADATTAGLVIVREAGALVSAMPVPTNVKDAIDCAVIKATGTSVPPSPTVRDVCRPIVGELPNGPGPLPLALGKLSLITAEPALKITANEIIAAIDPLIAQLEGSTVAPLRTLAAALRATFALVRGLLPPSPSPAALLGGVQ